LKLNKQGKSGKAEQQFLSLGKSHFIKQMKDALLCSLQ